MQKLQETITKLERQLIQFGSELVLLKVELESLQKEVIKGPTLQNYMILNMNGIANAFVNYSYENLFESENHVTKILEYTCKKYVNGCSKLSYVYHEGKFYTVADGGVCELDEHNKVISVAIDAIRTRVIQYHIKFYEELEEDFSKHKYKEVVDRFRKSVMDINGDYRRQLVDRIKNSLKTVLVIDQKIPLRLKEEYEHEGDLPEEDMSE